MTRCKSAKHRAVTTAFFGYSLLLFLLMPVHAAPKEIDITSFYAKVYVAPSKNANFIGLTQKGERYPILGTRDSWYHIRFKNVNGWIASTQVTVIDPDAPVVAAPSETTAVAGDTGTRSASVDSPGTVRSAFRKLKT